MSEHKPDCEEAELFQWLTDFRPNYFTIDRFDNSINYETVEDWLRDNDERGCYTLPEGEREKILASNDLWTIHVYPSTPVGFWGFAGASLEAVIRAARDAWAEEDGKVMRKYIGDKDGRWVTEKTKF